MNSNEQEIIFVSIGIRNLHGKECVAFYRLTPDAYDTKTIDESTQTQLYKNDKTFRNRMPGTPGHIYRVTEQVDPEDPSKNTIVPSSCSFIGVWPHKYQVTTWVAHDAIHRSQLKAKRKSKHDQLLDILAPIREVYLSTSPMARAQLIAAVVQRITR